jgi:hypothetical protein
MRADEFSKKETEVGAGNPVSQIILPGHQSVLLWKFSLLLSFHIKVYKHAFL